MMLAVLGMMTAVGSMLFIKQALKANKSPVEQVSVLTEPAPVQPEEPSAEAVETEGEAPKAAPVASPKASAEVAQAEPSPPVETKSNPTPAATPEASTAAVQRVPEAAATQPRPREPPKKRARPVEPAPPEVVEPAAPPPPEFVSFSIVSAPAGATISMGGERFVTPDNGARLPPGEYKAKVTFLSGASRTCRGIKPEEGKRLVFRESGGGCP